jgi:hypothetical protein
MARAATTIAGDLHGPALNKKSIRRYEQMNADARK